MKTVPLVTNRQQVCTEVNGKKNVAFFYINLYILKAVITSNFVNTVPVYKNMAIKLYEANHKVKYHLQAQYNVIYLKLNSPVT